MHYNYGECSRTLKILSYDHVHPSFTSYAFSDDYITKNVLFIICLSEGLGIILILILKKTPIILFILIYIYY